MSDDLVSSNEQNGVDGQVRLDQASDEDISAFLDNYPNALEQEENINEQAPDSQGEAVNPVEEPKAPPKDTRQEEENLRAKNEQLKQALEKQTLFAQRRSSEIGELRAQLRDINAKLSQGLNESFIEDPEAAIDRKLQIKSNEQAIKQLEAEDIAIQHKHRAFQTVAAYVQPQEFDVDAMADALIRDGLPAEQVQAIKRDPFSFADGPTLVQMAKRAHAEKALLQVVAYARQLEATNKELMSKPGQVLKGIETAARGRPMTAASGGSTANTKMSSMTDVSRMSDAEIDAFLRQSRQN